MRIKLYLVQIWKRLIGSATEFALPIRLFHSICLISILALAYNVPLNYFVNLPLIAIVSAVTLMLFGAIYYFSRFKRKTSGAMIAFCIIGTLLFAANFFMNSGIDGPTDLFFVLTMIMMIGIVPVRQYGIWLTANIILVLGLHYLQYYNPGLIRYTYLQPLDRFIDMSSAYITVVAVTLFSFYLIRRSYEIEKKSAEQKTAVMKLLNEEKNKLLSIISHDLRAPLSNIQNYLELLTELEISQEERQEIKIQLLQSTRSTIDLLNNVVSWSKNQLNGLAFNLSLLNVYELLSSQLLLFINIANSKKIKVEISIDPHINVKGNGDMLQLVVRNLINNAIKFTASGGKITITVREEDNSCIICVRDSGMGAPVSLAGDIFYLNSESTLGTANEKGVGLGLVLCKEFTEAQHGKIWFECNPLSGVSFFVSLPLVKEEPSLVLASKATSRLISS